MNVRLEKYPDSRKQGNRESQMANPGNKFVSPTPESGGGQNIHPQIQSVDDLLIQPVDEREEKTIYNAFYDRIYPMIRDNSLNFADVAEKTALPRRRLHESLLFRLGSGQVRQLFGHNPGHCYVCKNALYSKRSAEPLCLKCLQLVDSYITLVHGKKSSFGLNETVVPSPKLEIELGIMTATTENTEPSEATLPEDILPIEATAPVPTNKSADDILAILSYEEDELLETDLSMHEIDNMMQQLHSGPLRHYGFKRVKKANTTATSSQA